MKKTAASLLALAVLAAGSARAATIAQDTQELRLQGYIDPSTLAGSEIRLNVSYGFFFLDNFQAGGRADFADNDQFNSLGLGAFCEYNVDTGNAIMPFGEFFVGFANVDVEGAGGDDLAGRIEVRAGAKFFITENVAIAVAGVFAYATEKIYPDNNKLRDTDVFMELSLRCYF